MRIAEIAALVGVTTRAVRHYHHLGLLPEPARRTNGYRDYAVRDAVLLARIRRLTELGFALDEVRDVISDDAGRELTEVLGELDADLARQEAEIRVRRARLAELMENPPSAEGPVSPALARLLSTAPATDSPTGAKDRELLVLYDSAVGSERFYEALRPLAESPELLGLYRQLDELADAAPDDPRIAPLADTFVATIPDEVLAAVPQATGQPAVAGFGEALLADFPPAQAACARLVMEALAARTPAAEGGAS
ncbi:MerR family transcriptional regulator [Streptomyces sp. NPDC006195]|uniref:MerR family transcriptional regulator n=1 Tax=unclassified Streptomyces TaxID=2593676 RepID=UPI0033A1BA3B